MYLRYEEQVRDASRGGMRVDVGRKHRHHDRTRVPDYLGHLMRGECRWRVDNQPLGARRRAQGKGPCHAHRSLEAIYRGDRREASWTKLEPAHPGPLRIGVHERGVETFPGVVSSQIRSDGRLAGTALGVQQYDLLQRRGRVHVAEKTLSD